MMHNPLSTPLPRREWLRKLTRLAGHIVLRPRFTFETSGRLNLPQDGAFVLLPKHQRWEDIPFLDYASPRPLYYVAKNELFSSPLSDWFIKSLGGIPLNRKRPMESRPFFRSLAEVLGGGQGLVIFPEGTYFPGHVGPGRIGMLKFVFSRFRLPFFPVGIHYDKSKIRTRVRIRFGRACYPEEYRTAEDFLMGMMQQIASLSGLPMGETGNRPGD